jgi:hypothetical protein
MKFSAPVALGVAILCVRCTALQLPVPPEQPRPWKPDPAIPTNLVSAADELFEQGFPDPRGCEYREIEVTVSGVWDGQASLVKTHGWILPKKSGTNQFAICWNGLIYPVVKISGPADLHAEVTISNSPMPRGFGFGRDSAVGEVRSVQYANALSTRILLLLRCGETAAALTDWAPNQQLLLGDYDNRRRDVQNDDPYLEFAGDWAWAMFDRMISAHQRGDEALALSTALQLADVQPQIETECAQRGFPRQPDYDYRQRGQQKPYLDFLGQLPQILADLERRAMEPASTNIIETAITNYPDQTIRIAALIDDLDLVSARQSGQPGWVNLSDDKIVAALKDEGDPAVGPLLDCLEKDQRLTRSVGFGRDFFRNRTVIPVHDAARVALLSILRAGFTNDTEIRAYWEKYRNLKLEDRWYAILNDDSASARWREAAANIVQPENYHAPIRMDGETLRAKGNPSVSELMSRRALEVPTNNIKAYDLSTSCQMALYLAAWDPAAALPVARTISHRAHTVMQYSSQNLGPSIARLAVARANAGDPQAFDDYAAWIVTSTPEQLDFSLSDCLKPIKDFPANQVLHAAAAKMFDNTNSDWSRLPWKGTHGDDSLGLDLIQVPAFRSLIIRELDKTNIYGSFTWSGSGEIYYEIANYENGGYGAISFPEGQQPKNGATSEMRWCDWIAFSLSKDKQIPFFNPFAPVEIRDAEIDTDKALLGQN